MSNNVLFAGSPWSAFSGPNLGYVMEQYDLYLQSPEQVEPELVTLFQQFGAPVLGGEQVAVEGVAHETGNIQKIFAAVKLADALRSHGHLAADIYPLKDRQLDSSRIELSAYGLSEADLTAMPASLFFHNVPGSVTNGKQAIDYLRAIYTGKIAYEYAHVDDAERQWIQDKIESGKTTVSLTTEQKKSY